MSALLQNPVTIEQLRLNCGARQKEQVLDALDGADWPSIPDHQVVVVRRIEVNAEPWAIGREAAAELRARLQHVVAARCVAASDADAIRFADRADYLACLCQEILQPGSTPGWLWQGEPLKPSEHGAAGAALLRVLSDEPLLLPSLSRRLQTQQLLGQTLATLGASHIYTLTRVLVQHTGFAIEPAVLGTVTPPRHSAPSIELPGPLQAGEWLQVLHPLPSPLRPAAATLLALVLLWQQAPQLLHSAMSATACLIEARRRLLAEQAAIDERPGTAAEPSTSSAQPAGAHGSSQDNSAKQPGVVPSEVARAAPRASADSPSSASQNRPPEAASTPAQQPSPQFIADQVHRIFFLTAQGGFFYLLNLLRNAPAQKLLAASPASAWQHLYLLCRSLQQPLDSPLQQFIAAQLQFDDIKALRELQPGEVDKELWALAEHRLAHQPFWPHALFTRVARVHHDASHIDVDFHTNAVDLEIRLAGLDVDPGWLPWLGRVVRFHYLDDRALLGGGEP